MIEKHDNLTDVLVDIASTQHVCARCGGTLTAADSVADGMGRTCRKHQPHRRRIRFVKIAADGASIFAMYSRSRPGRETQHIIRVHFEHGEFSCTCEHHQFRGAVCEHIKRACDAEARRRERETPVDRARIYEHSCPSCLGSGCDECSHSGTVREVW